MQLKRSICIPQVCTVCCSKSSKCTVLSIPQDFFRRVFGQQTENQRQQQQRRQQWDERPRSTGDPRDSLGHYKRLGVDPGCSKDEIQVLQNMRFQGYIPLHLNYVRSVMSVIQHYSYFGLKCRQGAWLFVKLVP